MEKNSLHAWPEGDVRTEGDYAAIVASPSGQFVVVTVVDGQVTTTTAFQNWEDARQFYMYCETHHRRVDREEARGRGSD
jgi:hypothetical protein